MRICLPLIWKRHEPPTLTRQPITPSVPESVADNPARSQARVLCRQRLSVCAVGLAGLLKEVGVALVAPN